MPVWFDEYRPSSWDPREVHQVHHELRSVYGGETDERGLPSQEVRSYELRAPVIVSGESWISDTAIRERVLLANPAPDTIQVSGNLHTRAYEKLFAAPIEAFALPFWCWSLKQNSWRDLAESAAERVATLLQKHGSRLPNRVSNNLAICWFGIKVLERYLGGDICWIGGDIESAMLAMIKRLFPDGCRRTALDELLRLTASTAHRQLALGDHWADCGEEIVLRLGPTVDDLRRYARLSNHPTEILSEESYRQQVAELAGKPGSYVMNASRQAKFKGQNLRGVALIKSRLSRALGIDEEVWQKQVLDENEDDVEME